MRVSFASVLLIIGFGIITSSCKSQGCPAWLYPDITCRVLDEDGQRTLVQYYNLDTDDIKLLIQQSGKETPIEHPAGRVKNYSENLDSNSVKFDKANPRLLIVNGEKFEILEKN